MDLKCCAARSYLSHSASLIRERRCHALISRFDSRSRRKHIPKEYDSVRLEA